MKAISTTELRKLREEQTDVILVNTLAAESFEETRIPGAVNVPLEEDDFVRRVEALAGGKDRPVVVYCASRECNSSERAAAKLEEAGFTGVLDFAGGAAAWKSDTEKTNHSC
jgi:rhodanese-related sulfurtransferase